MKRHITLIILAFALCFMLVACNCDHQYEGKVTTEASCSAVGIKTFTCTLCQESYTEEIPMIEHTYTSETTKEPTCAEKGVTTFTCSVCNDTYTEEIETVAHTFGEATVTKEPTCIEEGGEVATCTVCGNSNVKEKIEKIAHSYTSKTTKEPTCTATGIKTNTCSVCGDTQTEEISKIAHNYVSSVTMQATCTSDGSETVTCKGCGDTNTKKINKLGHNYSRTNTTKQANCTEDGERIVSCSRCGDSYSEVVKSTGHNWINANCTEPKHCTNCNQTEGSALGHTTQSGTCSRCNIKISLASTCTLDIGVTGGTYGYIDKTDNIGRVRINEVNYSFSDNSDGTVDLVVTFTGVVEHKDRTNMLIEGAGQISNGTYQYSEDTIYAKTSSRVGDTFTAKMSFNNIQPGKYVLKVDRAVSQ